MTPVQIFESLCDRSEPVAIAYLHAFYDQLEPVNGHFMIGRWSGGLFYTGHAGESQLTKLQWYGKQFNSINDVDPILSLDADGKPVVDSGMGKATLRMVEYRNVVTATMVYDAHPIYDHFKRVDDNTVLAAMDNKGHAMPLYFYLRRAI